MTTKEKQSIFLTKRPATANRSIRICSLESCIASFHPARLELATYPVQAAIAWKVVYSKADRQKTNLKYSAQRLWLGHCDKRRRFGRGQFSPQTTLPKEEGITRVITKTHANQAERMIRSVKKLIGDRLRHYKTKTRVEVLKPSLNRYNDQIHSSAKTTANKAHNLDNVIQVRTHLIRKEKRNRKYPNISEGDYVKIFDKGKGNYVSRKETRSQWSERKLKLCRALALGRFGCTVFITYVTLSILAQAKSGTVEFLFC